MTVWESWLHLWSEVRELEEIEEHTAQLTALQEEVRTEMRQ
jgi:hypothetical protein